MLPHLHSVNVGWADVHPAGQFAERKTRLLSRRAKSSGQLFHSGRAFDEPLSVVASTSSTDTLTFFWPAGFLMCCASNLEPIVLTAIAPSSVSITLAIDLLFSYSASLSSRSTSSLLTRKSLWDTSSVEIPRYLAKIARVWFTG